MASAETVELARRAERIYEDRLRERLEAEHHGWFVTIEPDSGDYFLGRSLDDAAEEARKHYPDRRTFTRRIGYPVAVEIGICR
jgi:hypothetical protein